MACLNCDHTMQGVGESGGRMTFWCPRCGTLKMTGNFPEFETPTNNHLWPVKNIAVAPELLAVLKDCDWSYSRVQKPKLMKRIENVIVEAEKRVQGGIV